MERPGPCSERLQLGVEGVDKTAQTAPQARLRQLGKDNRDSWEGCWSWKNLGLWVGGQGHRGISGEGTA